MAIVKKTSRWLAGFFGFILACFLSLFGKNSAYSQMSPTEGDEKLPLPTAFHIVPSGSSTREIDKQPTANISVTATPFVEKSVQEFMRSNVDIPAAEIIMEDELSKTNPSLYKLLIEQMQLNLILYQKLDSLEKKLLDIGDKEKTGE